MPWYIFLVNAFELLACLTGFVYLPKLKGSYWYAFPFYLAAIFLTEVSAEYVNYGLGNTVLNTVIYKYFGIPLEFLFFYWLFYRYFRKGWRSTVSLLLGGVYVACLAADWLYVGRTYFFASFSYTVGNIVLLLLMLLFYVQFINSDEILRYRRSLMFWVCLGLLVFYLGTLPFYGLRNLLYEQYNPLFYVYHYVSFALNCSMYALFTVAFVCAKPNYRYS